MDSSTFVLFLILMGLALTTNNPTMMVIGFAVGGIFIITMGGAHHIIVAIAAIAVFWFVGIQNIFKFADGQEMMYALLIVAAIFLVFVLHGRDSGASGMEGYPMGGMPLQI